MYLWDVENRDTYNNRMGKYKTSIESNFLKKYITHPKTILDIGGGSGRFAIPFYQDGHKITLIDKDKHALSILSKRCPDIQYINNDFMHWEPQIKNSFDIILSIEVLLYIKDWNSYFKKVYDLLKTDGVFIFTATNKYSWRTIFQKLKDINKPDYGYSIFSLGEYKRIIKENSFVIDSVQGFLWVPCKINSDSKLVNMFAFLEKELTLNRLLSQSPWLIFGLKKNEKSVLNLLEHPKIIATENSLILVQWDSYYGGLEKLSLLYEQIFSSYNPLVVILSPTKKGFYYKNDYVFEGQNKLSFILKYLLFTSKRKNSIFHIQYAGSLILLLTYLAGARKIVFHFHGTQFSHKYFDKMVWKLLEEKVVVIANSKHTEQVIRQKLNIKSKINHIPNLIKVQDFGFFERKYSGGKFIVTFAGRFDKGKNLDLIIKVSKVLKNIDSNIEFIFAGDGPEKVNIEKKIRDNQLESFVKLFPYTNDILKLYHQSHLFIFASLHESFGNVIAEAILSGLPVLCYKIPALEELINDDYFFFSEQNPELIAKKLIEIKDNYFNVNERLKNVYDYVKQYLNEEEIINNLNNIYQGFKN